MKINEFEKKLKEIEPLKAPETVCSDVLSFAEKRSEMELEINKKQNRERIPILDRLLLMIAGSIPFFEIFWFMNEKFIKKNKIKLHW